MRKPGFILNLHSREENPCFEAHDPGMMYDPVSGYCYSYSTDTGITTPYRQGIQIRKSKDLIDFEYVGMALSEQAITCVEDMPSAARRILDYGCCGVLIKGGHLEGATKQDYLLYRCEDGNLREQIFSHETIHTPNTHGTGCTLSSAITAFLAQDYALEEAVARGREFLQRALIASKDVTLGSGHGALNHFFSPQKLIKNA